MEDWKLLAADGVIISCCCPCLILQCVVFIFFKLPHKLVRKSKVLVRRRISKRKSKKKTRVIDHEIYRGGQGGGRDHTRTLTEETSFSRDLEYRGAIIEVEEVMEEMYERGEFGFGSFWRREESRSFVEFDDNVHYQILKIIKSSK
ncbi:hypothetical protein GIB67_038508 [Kingdonia uniflora]|uniref:Transmembrane protein n=1 Tax=Kingdonia uniflora TaxID=39325 RepID=A0A7J7NP98_9MAGN|nr:hypothetical protein GIB67_038508 [Kingdonia uniflora]